MASHGPVGKRIPNIDLWISFNIRYSSFCIASVRNDGAICRFAGRKRSSGTKFVGAVRGYFAMRRTESKNAIAGFSKSFSQLNP